MRRLVGAFLIVSIAVIGGRYAFLKISELSWFHLKEVVVESKVDIPSDKVVEVSRLELGKSVFQQDYKTACDNLSSLAGVEDVYITRELPGKIKVELKPDSVELLIATGKIKGLTRTLKIVDLESEIPVLPVVTGLTPNSKKSYNQQTNLSYALSIHHELQQLSGNLSSRLSEIHFKDDETVVLVFNPRGAKAIMNLANFTTSLARLCIIDNKGLLGNSGSLDLRTGRIVVQNRT